MFCTLRVNNFNYHALKSVFVAEADKTIQAEKDETERLRQEKQILSEKHKNDPALQRLVIPDCVHFLSLII